MDAPGWNGDVDPREFSPHPDDERCEQCGATPMEECHPSCTCDACIAKHDRDADRHGDTA